MHNASSTGGKAAARGKRLRLVSPLRLPPHRTIRDCNDEQKGFYHSSQKVRVRPSSRHGRYNQ